ncbi:pre-mRNA-splicing factor SYF2 [Geosmithia morbida]|uniref:Pre-mRNA-splicing factor SYF2 n=1 Tax=Geosmithia morbida TaxID=1094350 RepID=A0A9P4YT61_9HYPO|nr:pre-mRNA-splicing factor SYF2 [Geosmithia morbida]KAF4121329.1 pre-mRNA-splicing factor SYF2 [Geosmithia morbida]
MAPPAKKHRTRAQAKAKQADDTETTKQQQQQQSTEDENITSEPQEESAPVVEAAEASVPVSAPAEEEPKETVTDENKAQKASDRLARFKALQARAKNSSESNLKEATLETQRLASDPSQMKTLNRRREMASQKLMRAEVEEAGGDFERKRAWDWTVEESEKWDKRVKKKDGRRDGNAFQDYRQESNKVYKRQLRNLEPDMERYEREKMALVERAAASGGLDIVETESGELIAVDKDGSFYSTADSTSFAQNSRPDKAAVDRLVKDLERAEEQRLKKRRERMAQSDDNTDVTYINEKNKQFNQKLSRFYDKYTEEIRDSFERGTKV